MMKRKQQPNPLPRRKTQPVLGEAIIGTYQPLIVTRRKGLAVLVGFLTLVLLVACAPQAAENTALDVTEGVVAENLPAIEQTQAIVTTEGETQLYTDAEFGFSFEYPTTWTVQANEGTSIVLSSATEGTRIDFTPMGANIVTLDAGVQAVRDSIAQNGEAILTDMEVRIADNAPAYRITTAISDLLVTAINERVLLITAQGDTSTLDLIQMTLRDVG